MTYKTVLEKFRWAVVQKHWQPSQDEASYVGNVRCLECSENKDYTVKLHKVKVLIHCVS